MSVAVLSRHIFSAAHGVDAMDVASGAVGSGDGCASLAAHAEPPGDAMDAVPVVSGLADAVAALGVDAMDGDPIGSGSCDKGARPEAACVLGSSHPPNQRRAAERKYWLFEAAAQGCQVCVAHYLEVEQVDPASKSGSRQYSVLE